MTSIGNRVPAEFTSGDYAARMARVVTQAHGEGLTGVIVAPGPDLVWLTGYRPTAITERLTILVLCAGQQPWLRMIPGGHRLAITACRRAGNGGGNAYRCADGRQVGGQAGLEPCWRRQ
jgi:hypothetical protein